MKLTQKKCRIKLQTTKSANALDSRCQSQLPMTTASVLGVPYLSGETEGKSDLFASVV